MPEYRNGIPIHELEGYLDMLSKLLQGLSVEERLAGLTGEQILLALPNSILWFVRDDALSALSPRTRELIRKRIGR